jgi:peroxiredoxin
MHMDMEGVLNVANLKIGDKPISFTLPGVDGKEYKLSDYVGAEALSVIFSCNHCPYVRAWEDRMVQIQADYADDGLQFLVINSNDVNQYPEDSFPKMKERAEEKGFNFPYLFDETQEIAHAYGAERTPEVFLFDQSGTLQYHGAIDDNYDDPGAIKAHYLRNALDAVFAGSTPSIQETPPVGCTIKWK